MYPNQLFSERGWNISLDLLQPGAVRTINKITIPTYLHTQGTFIAHDFAARPTEIV